MKYENSLPWDAYPLWQISKGSRPSPDPGQRTRSSQSRLLITEWVGERRAYVCIDWRLSREASDSVPLE